MKCPHCEGHIANKRVVSFVAKLRRRQQQKLHGSPNPKVLRPCKYCGNMYGAEEVRLHRPVCEMNPRVIKRSSKRRL